MPIIRKREGLCAPVDWRRDRGCRAIWKRAGHEASGGWRNSAHSSQNSTAQADGIVQNHGKRRHRVRRLFLGAPVRRWEGHLPEKGRGRHEFDGELCFSSFGRPTVHHAASDLFSGAEIGDRQGLARWHFGASSINAPCALITRVMVASENGVCCVVSPITAIGTRSRTR